MANTLGNYNPMFFANEALSVLYKTLGMGSRVYRGLDNERNASRVKGDTINIRRPSKFTAQEHVAGTGTTAQDIEGQNVQVSLNSHQEVKFKVTDRELAYTTERIINEHIAPAAYALVDKIDQDLHALGSLVGPKATLTGTINSTYITGPRKVLRNNEAPTTDLHYVIDTGMEAAFLDLELFNAARITGENNNEAALMNGSLGKRFGVEVFSSQNADVTVAAMTSTATASAGSGDAVGAVNGTVAPNVNQLVLSGMTGTETLKIGDTFKVAGDDTTYILTANTTLSSGAGTVTFFPALRKTALTTAVVTFDLLSATQEAAHLRNLMFHRNAFCLAFADLGTTGDGRGAEIASVVDDQTGLAVRARMWYDGASATNLVALDVLYGTQVLNGQLAVRALRAPSIAPV